MFGKNANGVHVLLHYVDSVIPAVFLFKGVLPTCPIYELFVCRTIYSPTIYVQQGHFDALMTVDLGAVCRSVCWLQLSCFICKPSQGYYPLILRQKPIMERLSQNQC